MKAYIVACKLNKVLGKVCMGNKQEHTTIKNECSYDSLKRNRLLYLLLPLLEKLSHVKCNLILPYLTNLVHILYFPPGVFAIYLYTFWAMADVSSISILIMLIKVQYHSADDV